MAAGKLREAVLAAGGTIEGERIVFDDERQLEHWVALVIHDNFEALGEMDREQRDTAYELLERWRQRFGSRYERLGREDHYAEGVTLHFTGVNRRQRRTDLPKADCDDVEAKVRSVAEETDHGS
jgi:phosphoglycolate phosphatase-like HAD superfamily hydrolase